MTMSSEPLAKLQPYNADAPNLDQKILHVPRQSLASIASFCEMEPFHVLVYLAYASLALRVDASWSALVRGCVLEDTATCEPGVLLLINETVWTGQLGLSYTIEAGLHSTQLHAESLIAAISKTGVVQVVC